MPIQALLTAPFLCGAEALQVRDNYALQVWNDRSNDPASSQHSVTILQQLKAPVLREMLQNMRHVDEVESSTR